MYVNIYLNENVLNKLGSNKKVKTSQVGCLIIFSL